MGFDPPRYFAAFLHTLRWNCVTATNPNLFQSPFRAGIKIDAYQMEPLRKALRLPRVNLFIADDTGLGKTIEAGLIARAGRRENENKAVLDYAQERAIEVRERYAKISDHFFPDSEIRGIAQSVERYREQWAGKWHSPQFIGRQKARGKRGGAASGKVRRKRTEIRDTMILAWWRAGYTQREIGAFIKLSQVRVCKIVNRDKDLPVPARMVGLRIWDPGVGESGGVIEPHRKARPRHEPVQTSLH